MKTILILLLAVLVPALSQAQLTIGECQRLARENYPLISQYDLISSSADYTVANIKRGYLPQIEAFAQATLQSDVMSWPGKMQDILRSYGYDLKGLKKDQYKVGVNLTQVIYDGGRIRAQKDLTQAESDAETRQTDVNLYALRTTVSELYFGILLLDEKLKQNNMLQDLLADSERKVQALVKNGVALASDADAIRVERLNARQAQVEIESARQSYRDVLSLFIGKPVDGELVKPEAGAVDSESVSRPEMSLFDAQIRSLEARRDVVSSGLRPSLVFFAQGFYGYPGFNTFDDMFSHDWSLNGLLGLKLSWSIGNLYKRKGDLATITLATRKVETARETFLFNNNVAKSRTSAVVSRYARLIDGDREIIDLRTSIRQAAEAKLERGVIDVNDLLREITNENQANISLLTHEIEMLKALDDLANTTGSNAQ